MNKKIDPYIKEAAKLFNVKESEVTREQRKIVKQSNFLERYSRQKK